MNEITLFQLDHIKDILKNANKDWGSRVYKYHPPNFNLLPVIAIYGNQKDAITGDGKGLKIYDCDVNISLWTKAKEDTYANEIIDIMHQLGCTVECTNIIRDIEGETVHMTMSFYLI